MTQTVLLGDVAEKIAMGPFGSNIKVSTFVESGIPIVSGQHLKGITVDDNEGYNFISTEHADKLRNSNVFRGDVVFTHAGNIGQVAYIPKNSEYDRYVLSQRQFYLRPSRELMAEYLTYYFKSPKGQSQLLEFANQTGVPSLSQPATNLKKIKIELPDIETQKKVADILGTIDEKIELNRQMNETLEQMGQALFRHYFIDNPEAEKWEKRELGEFFPIKTGKKDANFGTEDGEYPFFTCAQTISKAPDFSFDAHALLLAGNGDFNLKLYRGKFEAYQRTYVLIPDDERFVGILYFLMKMKLPEITGGSRGSVIKFITKGMIENYKFVLPNDSELAEMSEVFNQITVNIEENVKEIQTLTTLRGTLLPRLINGKLKV